VPATSALTAGLFGRHDVGEVFGWICCAHQAGAGLTSYLAGYLHSRLGDYIALLSVFMVRGIRR